jgi:TolA-binding protein
MQRRENLLRQVRLGAVLLLTCIFLLPADGRAQTEVVISQAEKNAWEAAARSVSGQFWSRAEDEYARFIKKFPKSEYYADAVLLEAQARFHLARRKAINQAEGRQWSFKDVISLLVAERSRADDRADAFDYWTAEAYYNLPDYASAAESYGDLARTFPDSLYRTEALYKEAEARSELHDTAAVVRLLGDPAGTFQQVVKTNAADTNLVQGLYLLTRTLLKSGDYAGAAGALAEVPPQKQDLEWQRQYLLAHVNSEGGHAEDALQAATNMLAAAGDNAGFRAKSYLMLGDIYRRLERWPEAIAAYQTNLADNVPPDQQRLALLNIVELNLRQNQLDEASSVLQEFVNKHPDETNSDLDLLALGELRLKQHYQAPGDTNFLQQAATNFQQLIIGDTNSPLWGKAQLNLGWCLDAQGRTAESGIAFSNAVARLPHDDDQAVALFKLAETQFLQGNYAGAAGNYSRVIDEYAGMASVTNNLFEPALYQVLRAGIAQNNFATASNALNQLLARFPEGLRAQPSMLLYGQKQDLSGAPEDARKTYADFITRWPESRLKPEAELAIARTYERENDWSNAVNRLYAWVAANTNSLVLPRAEFQLAWANWKNGNDTAAFTGFTNFLAMYPSNELAARAWLWLGSYYFQHGDFVNADVKFQNVFNGSSPAPPDLQAEARMMAGRAAFARGDLPQATNYFYALASDSNCPAPVRMSAYFALGDALKSWATQTNQYPFQQAIRIFADIATNTGDAVAPLAWGRLGDCYQQLLALGDTNSFAPATNAYQNVIDATNADLATRSAAEFGLGQVLEKAARLKLVSDPAREALLRQAVDHYLNVAYGSNRRGDEAQSDPWWVEQAGLQAATVEGEDLKEWDKAINIYEKLGEELPPLQGLLKKRIESAQKMLILQGKTAGQNE